MVENFKYEWRSGQPMNEHNEREIDELEEEPLISVIEDEGTLPLLKIDNALNDIEEIEELEGNTQPLDDHMESQSDT